MIEKARRSFFFLLYGLAFLMLFAVLSTGAPTAGSKLATFGANGITNLGPFNTITSAYQVGFTADEQLISATNTLLRPYFEDTSPEAATNITNNNNLCESPSDSYVRESFSFESPPEAYAMWITWDSANLYGAVQMFAQGNGDNVFVLLDTSPNLGSDDFTKLSAWQRELKFNGLLPDFFLGMYADYKNSSSAWYPDNTDGVNPSDAWCGYQFRMIDASGSILGGAFEYKDAVGAYTNGTRPWAGYTGTGANDADKTDNMVFFKVPWAILTNRVTSTFVGLTNWKIKICAATTGPQDGYPIYDWLPDSRYSVEKAAKLGIPSKQNNYFEIQVTDGSGNFRYPADLRADASIRFYPGSYLDVANSEKGLIPISTVDVSGNPVKGLAPHLGGSVYFKLELAKNTVNNCSLKVYDVKGNIIRTIFSGQAFEVPFGDVDGVLFNEDPSVTPTATLSWDGKTDAGNVAPMGIYFIVFKGEDGNINFTRKIPFMILK